jgi:hypothetical protein
MLSSPPTPRAASLGRPGNISLLMAEGQHYKGNMRACQGSRNFIAIVDTGVGVLRARIMATISSLTSNVIYGNDDFIFWDMNNNPTSPGTWVGVGTISLANWETDHPGL